MAFFFFLSQRVFDLSWYTLQPNQTMLKFSFWSLVVLCLAFMVKGMYHFFKKKRRSD